MNSKLKMLIALLLFLTLSLPAFCSDWDVAGKVLTGIEGLRVLSGGKIDVVGAVTGINRNNERNRGYHAREVNCYEPVRTISYEREWVPNYVWVERWEPAHREYDSYSGRVIFIDGHYVKYRVENGGHWMNRPSRRYTYNYGY